MKNIVKITGINLTVEGCPVQLEGIELTSEISAQEIATSGGLIKSLVSELKPLIQEATKPVTPTVTTTAPTNHNYSNNYKNKYNSNYGNNNYKNDNYKKESRQHNFDAIPKPEGFKEVGYKRWIYESGSFAGEDRLAVHLDNAKYGVIHINVMSAHQSVHIHIYPDNTTYNGASPETIREILKHIGMPEEFQHYILKVVAL